MNEQVALDEVKSARAATQIQEDARSVGVREKYGYDKKGIAYGKSQILKKMHVGKVEDMLEKATGENMQLDSHTYEHILKYAQTLDPQQSDGYYSSRWWCSGHAS